MDNARCADDSIDPETFFPNMGSEAGSVGGLSLTARRAKRICDACPVKAQCLQVAMDNEKTARYRWGIWGGLTPAERHEVAKGRRAA